MVPSSDVPLSSNNAIVVGPYHLTHKGLSFRKLSKIATYTIQKMVDQRQQKFPQQKKKTKK
jgi:hypothetical protein